jgi:hypothetical protein
MATNTHWYWRRGDRDRLARTLADILDRRDRGLVTQSTYDLEMEDIQLDLRGEIELVEFPLRFGATRYVIRDGRTGRRVDHFDFHRGHCPSR